jgi:hypothetical protein
VWPISNIYIYIYMILSAMFACSVILSDTKHADVILHRSLFLPLASGVASRLLRAAGKPFNRAARYAYFLQNLLTEIASMSTFK